jgi:hypothetical protein
MMTQDLGDTPIDRKDIAQMTDEQIDEMLEGIRERRLKLVAVYEAGQQLRKEKAHERAADKLDKQLEMFKKDFDQLEKVIAKLEKRALNVRALRLELED